MKSNIEMIIIMKINDNNIEMINVKIILMILLLIKW